MADSKNYGTITLLSDGRIGQKWVSTISGSPTGGPYNIADIAVGDDGYMWVSTVAGTPGTWQQIGTGTLNGSINLTGSMIIGTGLTVTTGGALITGNSIVTGTLNVTSTLSAASLTLTSALTVPNGGTGQITLTNHGVLVGAGTAAITQLSEGATNSVLQGTTSSDPAFTTTPTVGSLTLATGNLTFSTTGQRITGDFSNATFTNRTAFQDKTAQSSTRLMVFPNGPDTGAGALAGEVNVFGVPASTVFDPANATVLSMGAGGPGAQTYLNSTVTGTGTQRSLNLQVAGTTYLTIPTTGGVQVNSGNLGIGTGPLSNAGVINRASVTSSGSFGVGYRYDGTITAGANADGLYGIDLNPTYTANSKTGLSIVGLFIEANSAAPDSTSNKYGINIGSQTGANSANYGIFIQAPSGATTNEGLHNVGTTNLVGATTMSSAAMTGNLTFSGATRSIWTSDANELDLGANGAAIVKLTSGGGAQIGAPTGGDQGAGTLNATNLYVNGNAVATSGASNLLVNGGFEIWQRGNGAFTASAAYTADRWQITLAGTDTISVSKDTIHNDTQGLNCAACTFTLGSGAGASALQQKLEDYSQLRGQTISVSVRVNQSVANAVKLGLVTSSGTTLGSTSATTGSYVTLTVSRLIAASDTTIILQINLLASATIYLDNAMLVPGSQALSYTPLTPADELARCQRYYEVLSGQVSSESPIILQAGSATTAAGQWRFKTQKAVSPTMTIVNTASWACLTASTSGTLAWSSNSFYFTSVHAAGISPTCATGLVSGNATLAQPTNVNAQIVAEANP